MDKFEKMQCEDVSQILKTIAHPSRLKLLCTLMDHEMNVSQLSESCETSQSQMSQFLGRMYREGIVNYNKKEGHTYYFIADKKIKKLILALIKIYRDNK